MSWPVPNDILRQPQLRSCGSVEIHPYSSHFSTFAISMLFWVFLGFPLKLVHTESSPHYNADRFFAEKLVSSELGVIPSVMNL